MPESRPEPLSRRALNRALLARQHLLERSELEPLGLIEHLGGLQAQEPQGPFVALWSRIAGFGPEVLSRLISERLAVRAGLMRATIHLVSSEDALGPLSSMRRVMARTFRGSPFARGIAPAVLDEVVELGAELTMAEPRTRAELACLLGERWPGADTASLAHAASFNLPLVQVPPRGLWRQKGAARWAHVRAWLGRDPVPDPSLEDVVLRYLGAFGPATVKDIQAWCGLTKLRAVADGLGERLVRLRDEDGRELLDVPGAPLPGEDTPAPVRFLSPFDNVILGHDDRSRVITREQRAIVFGRTMQTFLVDGFVAGTWRIADGAIVLGLLADVDDLDPVRDEAARLLGFLDPEAGPDPGRVRFDD